MPFNTVLRELRIRHNLTQKMLGKALGLSESTIGMYERGQREPDFETLEAIADYFNVDMNYLTGRSEVSNSHGAVPPGKAGQYAQIDSAFFRVLEDAKSKGYTAEDIQLAIDFLDRARRRDQE